MPPKQAKSKASVKAETHEKVREIRLRQQKWLQEREKSIQTTPKSNNSKVNKPLNNPQLNSPEKVPQSDHDTTTKGTPTNSGFNKWLTNRNKSSDSTKPEANYDPSIYHEDNHHFEDRNEELTRLNLPSSRSAVSSVYSHTTESEFQSISQQASTRTVAEPTLSPDKFDTLADEIVNRVKKELSLVTREDGYGVSGEQSNTVLDVGQTIQEHDDGTNKLSNIPSHSCPCCNKLMLPPTCRPLLLIPCGHTSCQNCRDKDKCCPLCHHPVQSATPNIMLQQIIVDYHQRSLITESHDHNEPARSKRLQAEQVEPPRHQMGKTYSQLPAQQQPPKTPRKTASEYEEEYRNLLLRCDVLHEEDKSICDKMAALEQEKQGNHDQIANIGSAQERLSHNIKQIEAQIEELDRHKEGYSKKIEDIEGQRNKERRRLEMVRNTVSQLRTEIKKIKCELQDQY